MLNLIQGLNPLLAALALIAPPGPAVERLCSLQDQRITESSGVAVTGEVVWTHNDSGDSARFFALDRRCRTLATYSLRGVQATDWEDMAQGAGALWFGDIGDNREVRTQIQVHRVSLPSTRPSVQRPRATTFRFRYSDGAHDAEALLVDPQGRLFIVTKSYGGTAAVFAAPPGPSTTEVNVLTQVGSFSLAPSGTPGGPVGSLGQVSVTGGDINTRGDRLVVRTYTDAYEWVVSNGDVAKALTGTPTRTALPQTAQGEAIAYDTDGRSWITTSEGVRPAVHRLSRR